MVKLKVGVLGASNHFLKRIILPLQHTQYCEIHAIASRNIEKANKLANAFGIPKAYSNYQDLIEDADIDFVYIPLPNHVHLEWVGKAARAGKHILCEKPITLNTKEAESCLQEAEKNKVILMEAFMYKFHPQWIYAKELIKTNQIGNIMYINTSFAYHNPAPNNIRNVKEFGGGALMDIGCYAISVCRFLLDKEPQKVISLQEQHPTFKTDQLSSALLDFDGIHASYTVSTLSHANQYVEVIGSSGRIRIPIPFNAYVDVATEIMVSTAQGDRTVAFEVCNQYGLMFDAFANSLIHENSAPVNAMDALNNMKVIDAIALSAKSKRWEELE